MFVGYAKDHAGDCYCMYNPKTGGTHTTRDIIWLRRMYYPRVADGINAGEGDSESSDDEVSVNASVAGEGSSAMRHNG